MSEKQKINIFWFRRDLRIADNTALHKASVSGIPVLPVFIFDTHILNKLEKPRDLRVQFIHQTLVSMDEVFRKLGSGIHFSHASPDHTFKSLIDIYDIDTVFTNQDYEPYALERDNSIADLLSQQGINFQRFKDQVIFEKLEVTKDDGSPYTVFTPYSRKWKIKYKEQPPLPSTLDLAPSMLFQWEGVPIPSLLSMGFMEEKWAFPSIVTPMEILQNYSQDRDFPAINGTSRLGIHLRFGTISIRELAQIASNTNETYLNELIWRDFYHMILSNFPQVGKGISFKKEYDAIEWRNHEEDFDRWCQGMTGYPIVDAGMRELKSTGFMHNRVRMITASFLTKHLLIDWRWGEAWFASHLLDFDLAANNGGWQWAAGSGCDAAPYFRVFNPTLQAQKFDKNGQYIRKWVPEIDSLSYVQPMVNHEFARKRCLDTYARFLKRD
jgi:deoxyribodipyrimidine photo-lyase